MKTILNPMRLLAAIPLVFAAMIASCIGSVNEPNLPDMPDDDSVVIELDTADLAIDSTFRPSASYLQAGWWLAEYSGFDPLQNHDFIIRRQVLLNADSTYVNLVQGIPMEEASEKMTYMNFEHEEGTYSFDSVNRRITFFVRYDSLVNFATKQLEHHDYKMQGTTRKARYSERVWLTEERGGRRQWVRQDENLRDATDPEKPLTYHMNQRYEEE